MGYCDKITEVTDTFLSNSWREKSSA